MHYPWYSVVTDNEIQQGDLLFKLEVPLVHHTEGEPLDVVVQTFDAIVMTQSCDIPKPTLDYLILCPVWGLEQAAKLHPDFGTPGGKENLRQGRFVALHLLNKCEIPGFERGFMVVQFERVLERPKASIQEFVSRQNSRLRLLPPYREHLAQAFARFFMRVGLPIDIQVFAR